MPDGDYNTVKPVESLQNITQLTPAKRREERKRRRDSHTKNKQESEHELDRSAQEKDLNDEFAEDNDEQHSIDYCA
ncbi:MAG: hypothetical protein ACYS4W_00060 [Planctomycetota bacterium]|jgi:hypothetical protein